MSTWCLVLFAGCFGLALAVRRTVLNLRRGGVKDLWGLGSHPSGWGHGLLSSELVGLRVGGFVPLGWGFETSEVVQLGPLVGFSDPCGWVLVR